MKMGRKANIRDLIRSGAKIVDAFLEPDPKDESKDEPEAKVYQASSPHEAEDLEERAFTIRGEGASLPTKIDEVSKERVIAWAETATEQIKMEARFISAAVTFMLAAGLKASDSADRVEELARTAALWWHGQTESDVPKS